MEIYLVKVIFVWLYTFLEVYQIVPSRSVILSHVNFPSLRSKIMLKLMTGQANADSNKLFT